MDQCPRCGASVAAHVMQCPQCGLSRAPSPQPAPRQPIYAPLSPLPQPSPPRRSRGGVLAAVLGALAIGFAVLGGAFWYQGYGPGADTQGNASEPSTQTPSTSVVTPTETSAVAPTETPSTQSSTAPETASPSTTDLAGTYADVESGVGFVAVETCAGFFTGSGFLVDEQRVVTAAHVIEGATGVQVEFGDELVDASVQGIDLAIDLAVLKLEQPVDHHLFDIARADPDPGTSVAVIGFPFGEPKSLTEGTISGLDREITFGSRTYTGLLQTDAAINPGNSGGPVVSTDGSIVGMADAIRRRSQGIGFAVPVSQLRPAIEGAASLAQPELPSCEPPPAEPDPVLAGVGKTLQNHIDAINARDYRKDMRQFSATGRADSTPEQWYDDYATTYDDLLRIEQVTGPPAEPLVLASFRSRQDPGYGPVGAEDARCLHWSIEYEMARQGARWVISGSNGVGDPPWTRCD